MTKTTRVMLAVLALCGTSAALAQSSVNLYGRVNTTIERVKIGNESVTEMNSNSSYIGFRGEEDLGAGVKAGFKLEGNFGSDDGAGFDFKRHSELNLSGNFGLLRLGNFLPASYDVTADWISMHNHDTGLSADNLYVINAEFDNKVAYRTPEFGGFTGEVQYSFHEQATGGKAALDLALNYANGPLGFGLGYSDGPLGLGTYNSNDAQQLAARVSYALGDLVLGAYYQYAKLENVIGNADAKRNAYRLSAMYVLGASEFHANIGRADKVKLGSAKQINTSATQWTLGYNHNLSKRTKAYAYYTKTDNGSASNYATGANGSDLRSVAVGIRHLF